MGKSKLTRFKERIEKGGLGDPKLFSEISDYVRMQTKLLKRKGLSPSQEQIIQSARDEAEGLLSAWPARNHAERH